MRAREPFEHPWPLNRPFHKFGHVYVEARWTVGNFGHGMPCPYVARRPTDLLGHSMLCPPARARNASVFMKWSTK